jgi:hypothetical protein
MDEPGPAKACGLRDWIEPMGLMGRVGADP